jgi:hypothetical protein
VVRNPLNGGFGEISHVLLVTVFCLLQMEIWSRGLMRRTETIILLVNSLVRTPVPGGRRIQKNPLQMNPFRISGSGVKICCT